MSSLTTRAVVTTAALALAAAPAAALARVSQATPVAGSFSSNGDVISGWSWLRTPGHTASWQVDTAALAGARRVHLNLSALVTQRANGGSGYSATVKVRLDAGARSATLSAYLRNPFQPVDPDDAGGIGYAAYGATGSVPASVLRASGRMTVSIAYPFSPRGRHVAVKADSLTIGYTVR